MREFCNVCYQPNATPFVVPDAVWQRSVPKAFRKAELCLMCFAKFADEQLVPWCETVAVNPISRVGVEYHRQQQLRLADEPFQVNTLDIQ